MSADDRVQTAEYGSLAGARYARGISHLLFDPTPREPPERDGFHPFWADSVRGARLDVTIGEVVPESLHQECVKRSTAAEYDPFTVGRRRSNRISDRLRRQLGQCPEDVLLSDAFCPRCELGFYPGHIEVFEAGGFWWRTLKIRICPESRQ